LADVARELPHQPTAVA